MQAVTLFDGGVGQEAYQRSNKAADPLWSIKVMLEQPHIIEKIHRDFIEAGCQILTLNTYTATPSRLSRLSQTQKASIPSLQAIYKQAIQIAKQSKKGCSNVQIAGCLPPIVASYYTHVCLSYEESLQQYREIVALQQHDVDFFICETMCAIDETRAAIKAASETDKPVIVAFSLAENSTNCLRSGESLEEAITVISAFKPVGIMLNCSLPETISYAMPTLAKIAQDKGLRFGAYANGFESVEALKPGTTVDNLNQRADLSPEKYANFIMQWQQLGATLLGGCCGISPQHMRVVHQQLIKENISPTALI